MDRCPQVKKKLWVGNFGQMDSMFKQLVNMEMKKYSKLCKEPRGQV